MIFAFLSVEETWIPPLDFGTISTDVFNKDKGFLFQYFKVTYHSTLIYSMVDVSVRTFDELMFLSALLIVSAIINAVVFGQFQVLTEELKRDQNEFMDKLNLINAVLIREHVPSDLKSDIRQHILQTHSLKKLQEEQIAFNKSVSPSMQTMIRTIIFTRTFEGSSISRYMKTSLYKEELEMHELNKQLAKANKLTLEVVPAEQKFNRILRLLATDTQMQFYEPDVKVVEQGHRDTEFMYIIAQGACKVSTYFYTGAGSTKLTEQIINHLQVSDYFGEIALVYDSVRSASVTSSNYCAIGKIKGTTLWSLCANYTFFRKALMT